MASGMIHLTVMIHNSRSSQGPGRGKGDRGAGFREVAETIGKGLKVPVVSIPSEKAGEHFGWLAHFAGVDMPASSEWTRKTWGGSRPGRG
jgi:hypothetical protein